MSLFNARQEMERKRLEEWEKQRKAELTEHRQREQDKLFALKARQENLNQELENLVRFHAVFTLRIQTITCTPNCREKRSRL